MRLSYSSISTYKKCPLSYKFAYIDRLPRKKSAALSFGGSIHRALYFFFSSPTLKPPSLDELLENLSANWISDGYASESEEESYKELAKKTVSRFYEKNATNFIPPLALEHKFQIEIDGEGSPHEKYFLTGVIDRVQKGPDGEIEVIDYKTSKRLPPLAQVENDLQLSIYHYAVKEIWGVEPKRLTLCFVLPEMEMTTSRGDDDIRLLKEEILKTASLIDEKNFEPVENPLCHWCDFQEHCPLFKHKFQTVTDDSKIEDKVEEYVRLREEIYVKKVQIDALREDILGYLLENDLKRVFSKSHALTLSEYQDYEYDLGSVRKVLEPLGLLDEAVEVRKNLLSELIASGRLSKEQIKDIEAAKVIKRMTRRLSSKKLED
ncbi:MAG: PD-(D/E)XK nuclease family protein [Actinomycetota bacterium]|nr:PD-(D/E)XK nuclease family protein [Actinomycetota bacterium]